MKVIDLFAGCGGMSFGFQNAGYTLLAAYDHWKPAVEVYRKNFDHPVYEVDLATVADYQIFTDLQPDVIIGGPPCQDYSSAGKRDEEQGRADLTVTFAQIVASVCPKWVVMENVDLIARSANLQKAKHILKSAGYAFSETILNASFYGVPQTRKRYFLVGELHGQENSLNAYCEKRLSAKPMTVFDYLGTSLGLEYYYRHPRSYARRGVFSIHEPSPTIRGVNRPIPKTYKPHPNDAAPITPDVRPLTTLERSYVQTFPNDFAFEGSKTDLEQMIGNAVPVKLAEFVAKCILQYAASPKTPVNSAMVEQLRLL